MRARIIIGIPIAHGYSRACMRHSCASKTKMQKKINAQKLKIAAGLIFKCHPPDLTPTRHARPEPRELFGAAQSSKVFLRRPSFACCQWTVGGNAASSEILAFRLAQSRFAGQPGFPVLLPRQGVISGANSQIAAKTVRRDRRKERDGVSSFRSGRKSS